MLNKIKEFLEHKQLPEEKKLTINQLFEQIIRDKNMYTPIKGASPIKSVYMCVVDDIMPIFQSAKHLDFTGAMFNEFYSWLPFRPGDDKNDVVLTPRYVTEFMARLCRVNMDSSRRKRTNQESKRIKTERGSYQTLPVIGNRIAPGYLYVSCAEYDSYG